MHPADLKTRRDTLRARLSAVVDEYAQRHKTEIESRNRAGVLNQERKAKIIPPMAIEITVGAGKSRAVADVLAPMLVENGMPLLILAPTRALCREYEKALISRGIQCTVYQPRESAQNEADSTPFSCYQKSHINQAGTSHHRPAQSICRQCPNGKRAIMLRGDEDTIKNARDWLTIKGYTASDIDAIPPCRYLYEGLPDQLTAQVLIAPVSAYSEALATAEMEVCSPTPDGTTLRRVQRMIVIDERFPMTEHVHLSADAVEQWLSGIRHMTTLLERQANNEAKVAALQAAREALEYLATTLRSDHPVISDRLREQISTAYELMKRNELADGGTACFERISFLPADSSYQIPMRAVSALNHALMARMEEIDGQALRILVNKPIIDWIIRKGSTLIIDATLDPTVGDLITQCGGTVERAHIPQNIHVRRYTGKFFSRGNVRAKDYHDRAQREMEDMRCIAADMPKPAAIITHLAYLKHAHPNQDAEQMAKDFEAETGVKIGWFGMHDRGHNEWAGHHIAIVGMNIPNPPAIMAGWHERRILMHAQGVDNVPPLALSGDATKGVELFIPKDPIVRQWLFDLYAATLVQAIGRARGINHDGDKPLEIRLYGGIEHPDMDAALEKYDIRINEVLRYERQRKNDPRWRIRAAIEAVASSRRSGRKNVSRDAVVTWLRRAGHPIGSTAIIDEEIRKWRSEQIQ